MIKDYYKNASGTNPLRGIWTDSIGVHIDFPDVTVHMTFEDYDEFANAIATVQQTLIIERATLQPSNEPSSEETSPTTGSDGDDRTADPVDDSGRREG
jgi:hypothetical protein